jgi:hypothetical protein
LPAGSRSGAPPVGHFDTLGNFGRYLNAEVDADLGWIAARLAPVKLPRRALRRG